MSRPQRRVNGDGSLTRRVDGRWMGRYYAWTNAGTRKRIARAFPSPIGLGNSPTGSTTG